MRKLLALALLCAMVASSPAAAINAQRDNGSAGGKRGGESADTQEKHIYTKEEQRVIREYNHDLRKYEPKDIDPGGRLLPD
jgi:hypothetical protein